MKPKAEEYVALVTAFRQNTTLKTLQLHHCYYPRRLTDDEVKQSASLLKEKLHIPKASRL
jgi:hypothetical protein